MDGTIRDIELLGQLCGKSRQAETLVAGLKDRIQPITDKTVSIDRQPETPGLFPDLA